MYVLIKKIQNSIDEKLLKSLLEKNNNYLIPASIIVDNICLKRFFVCNSKFLYALLKLSEENMIISAPNQDKCLKNFVKFSSTNEHLFYN